MCLLSNQGYTQSQNFGNIFIASEGELSIHNNLYDFQIIGGSLLGIVGTERTSPQGYLSFVGIANHINATDNAHVDGYVKSYMTLPFIFPIGDNNKYRPAAISIASESNPTDAAYFGVSASGAVTSSLKGGSEPILPTGGPFSINSFGTGVIAIDGVEYWDINGATAAKITLTWDVTSGINTLTNGNLTALSILGWDGTKWVKVPSTFDVTSILGSSSSLTNGSITTDSNIIPNTYSVYTLGTLAITSPDLTISVGQPSPSPIALQTSNIPITVSNIGSAPSTGLITVVVKIPLGTIFGTLSAINNGWSCSTIGTTATCTNANVIATGGNSIFYVPFIPTGIQVGNPLTIPIATVNGGGELPIYNGNNTSTPIITPNVESVDLMPNFTFSSTSYTLGAIKTLIINLNEIGGISTNGSVVELFIPYSTGFTYSFNSSQTTATVLIAEPVNNANWTLVTKPTGLLLSSNTTIPSNGRSRIALTITAITAGTTATITANITPSGGGETNGYNNAATLAQSIQE
jgi:hypothetical protein